MSFLAPLYFLGGLAIVGPIIFHLIRRQPKGEVEFSSLMFLDATPPRLTRRSRLENWPLLLLRCAAILLLALAFARPFLPVTESESVAGVKQAVVILVDRSASMKRSGLWEQATKKAGEILGAADEETILSVVAFDSSPESLLSLEESVLMVPEARRGAAKDALKQLSPSWDSTDIGKAIRYAADQAALLELGDGEDGTADAATDAGSAAVIETRIVLLSDLQSGAEIETLQGYEWPERVWLDVQTLSATTRGNATLQVLPQTAAADFDQGLVPDEQTLRVMVKQASDGETSTFRLRFEGRETDAATVQVPPGQTKFFQVPLPTDESGDPLSSNVATLTLSGDQDEFDNSFHFVRPERVQQQIRFIEPDSNSIERDSAATDSTAGEPIDSRKRLSFYAAQVPWSDSTRKIDFQISGSPWPGDALDPMVVPLVVTTASASVLSDSQRIEEYLRRGGRVLVVLDRSVEESVRPSLAALLGSPELSIEEGNVDDYQLISSVDFKSALIAPLSDPGVNDFSNIRIWKHRVISGFSTELKVTLKLDDGTPLLLTRDFADEDKDTPIGKLWVLSTGWQPGQSQLALSTKFVPILLGMLGPNRQLAPDSFFVGDVIEQSDDAGSEAGKLIAAAPGALERSDGSEIAVNVKSSESETTGFDFNRLAEFGAVVSSPAAREQEAKAERALRDVELEARQGWWQWLVLATLGLIAAETILAARNNFNVGAEA